MFIERPARSCIRTDRWAYAHVMSEAHTKPVALTPSTYGRLAEYAKKHQWTLSAAACYLIEDGMDSEERRAKLAREARERPDIDKLAAEYGV